MMSGLARVKKPGKSSTSRLNAEKTADKLKTLVLQDTHETEILSDCCEPMVNKHGGSRMTSRAVRRRM